MKFGGGVSVGGVPVDPRTQMPVPHPSQSVARVTWVDFRFDGIGVSAIGLLRQSVAGTNSIAEAVYAAGGGRKMTHRTIATCLLVALALVLLASITSAMAQDTTDLEQRISRLESRKNVAVGAVTFLVGAFCAL